MIQFTRYPSATAKAWCSQWCAFMHMCVYIYMVHIKIPKSQNPKIQKSKNPKLFTSTESCKKVWIFGISGSVALWLCGYLGTKKCISACRRGVSIYMYIYILGHTGFLSSTASPDLASLRSDHSGRACRWVESQHLQRCQKRSWLPKTYHWLPKPSRL